MSLNISYACNNIMYFKILLYTYTVLCVYVRYLSNGQGTCYNYLKPIQFFVKYVWKYLAQKSKRHSYDRSLKNNNNAKTNNGSH